MSSTSSDPFMETFTGLMMVTMIMVVVTMAARLKKVKLAKDLMSQQVDRSHPVLMVSSVRMLVKLQSQVQEINAENLHHH